MGAHKQTHCRRGHELKEPNLIYNSNGHRQCRACCYNRKNISNKEKRDAARTRRDELEIFWTRKLKLPNEKAFQDFVQKMANRLMQGYCRYGGPHKEQKYMTRLVLELRAYKKTGNAEHLYNIANYAHLECCAPENKRFHFDAAVDSASRGKI